MTLDAKYTRNVWIDSEINSIGNGTNVKVIFQPQAFSINSGEQMNLQISLFEMRQSWYSIATPNNTIYWYGKTAASPFVAVYTKVEIPEGSYRDFNSTTGLPIDVSLVTGIKAALINAKDTNNVIIFGAATTVIYDNVKRQFKIQLAVTGGFDNSGIFVSFQVKATQTQPAGVSLDGFFNDSSEIFGAYTTTNFITVADNVNMFVDVNGALNPTGLTAMYSPFVAQLSSLEAVYVRTTLPTNSFQTYGFERSLPNQSGLTNSSIWGRIPLTNSVYEDTTPFLVYEEQGGSNFCMYLQQKQLDTMIIQITDDKGRDINLYAPKLSSSNGSLSFKMCLRWEIVDNIPITEKLININSLKNSLPIIKP